MNRLAAQLLLAATSTVLAFAAHAQAFRTYLSSAGNDANPCSVSLPCRLLPAALNAVANGGEIWMLDSANYNAGTVNVQKSVTIMAIPGQVGSIVSVGGQAALTINGNALKVTLRNLTIADNASNHGTLGVTVGAGATVVVESVVFENIVQTALSVNGTNSTLHVRDSIVRNGQNFGIVASEGAKLTVERTSVVNNGQVGIVTDTNGGSTTTTHVTDSSIVGNGTGISSTTNDPTDSAVSRVYFVRSTLARNALGINTSSGNGGTAQLTLTGSSVGSNGFGWLVVGAGATLYSTGNNHLADPGGTAPTSFPLQ